MANMLRKGASSEFGCCDKCESGRKRGGRKGRKRERSMARAREKAKLMKDYIGFR